MRDVSEQYKTIVTSTDNVEYRWELECFIIPKTVSSVNKNRVKTGLFRETETEETLIAADITYKVISFNDIDSLKIVANSTLENSFSLGCVAAKGLDISIYNEDGYFDSMNFSGAMIVPRYILLDSENNEIEKLQMGVFFISEISGDEIKTFICYDGMIRFDKKYKMEFGSVLPGAVSNPKSIDFINMLCGECNILMPTDSIPQNVSKQNFLIHDTSRLKNKTCRSLLSYTLELMGARAIMDCEGRLSLKAFSAGEQAVRTIDYYDMSEYEKASDEIRINGFYIKYGKISYNSEEADADVIFKIRFTADNPLLYKKSESAIDIMGDRLYNLLNGYTYLPCKMEMYEADPSIEAGDFIRIQDKTGAYYNALVSQITFTDNMTMEIISAGETTESNSSEYEGGTTTAIDNSTAASTAQQYIENKLLSITFTDSIDVSAIKGNKNFTFEADVAGKIIKIIEDSAYYADVIWSKNEYSAEEILQNNAVALARAMCFGCGNGFLEGGGSKHDTIENVADIGESICSICYGDGYYLVFANLGHVYKSQDGNTWEMISTINNIKNASAGEKPYGIINGSIYTDGYFYAFPSQTSKNGRYVCRSKDGTAWENYWESNFTSGTFGIAYQAGSYIFALSGGTSYALDLVNKKVAGAITGHAYVLDDKFITLSDGRLLWSYTKDKIVQDDGYFYVPLKNEVTSMSVKSPRFIRVLNNIVVLAHYKDNKKAYAHSDQLEFAESELPFVDTANLESIQDVLYGDGTYIAVTTYALYKSTNLINWTVLFGNGEYQGFKGGIYKNGKFIITTQTGKIYTIK